MALVRQPKTAGFRLKSRYDIGDWLSEKNLRFFHPQLFFPNSFLEQIYSQ